MADGTPSAEHRHYVLWLINAVQDWNKPALLQALCTTPLLPGADEAGSKRNLIITAELGDREAPKRLSRGININDHKLAEKRAAPYGRTEYTPLGALMHEGGHSDYDRFSERSSLHSFDEYFVPIPVKCIGDHTALRNRANAFRAKLALIDKSLVASDAALKDGEDLLTKITTTYSEYFSGTGATNDTHFTKYWDEGLSGAPTKAFRPEQPALTGKEVRMHSEKYVGYYEMLIRWNERPGRERDRHILLGYSQGGLVGRFVAFLDEHVFKLGLVHGVVTVQTPNFGSPVAAATTARPLEEIFETELPKLPLSPIRFFAPKDLHGLLTFLIAQRDLLHRNRNEPDRTKHHRFLLESLDKELEKAVIDIRQRIDRGESVSPAASQEFIDMFVSARKWLSGLCADRAGPKFAFVDLSPRRNYEDGRVLQLLNHHEHGHGIAHAAVVGCNPSLEALAGDGLKRWAVRIAAAFRGISLGKLTARYQDVFNESPPRVTAAEERPLSERYVAAITARHKLKGGTRLETLAYRFISDDFKEKAHDCVIPSTHQMMPPLPRWTATDGDDAEPFLGNWVNVDSNHASGTGLTDARPSCLEHVLQIFRLVVACDDDLERARRAAARAPT